MADTRLTKEDREAIVFVGCTMPLGLALETAAQLNIQANDASLLFYQSGFLKLTSKAEQILQAANIPARNRDWIGCSTGSMEFYRAAQFISAANHGDCNVH